MKKFKKVNMSMSKIKSYQLSTNLTFDINVTVIKINKQNAGKSIKKYFKNLYKNINLSYVKLSKHVC